MYVQSLVSLRTITVLIHHGNSAYNLILHYFQIYRQIKFDLHMVVTVIAQHFHLKAHTIIVRHVWLEPYLLISLFFLWLHIVSAPNMQRNAITVIQILNISCLCYYVH